MAKYGKWKHVDCNNEKSYFICDLSEKLNNYENQIINFDNKMTDNEFMRAIKRIPEKTILVLEDIDVLFQERKKNDEYKSSITFSGLLNSLDGIAHQDKLITIMTSIRISEFPPP